MYCNIIILKVAFENNTFFWGQFKGNSSFVQKTIIIHGNSLGMTMNFRRNVIMNEIKLRNN